MVFGWLLLGNRGIKKKIIHLIILSLFVFLLAIIILGPRYITKVRILITWIFGSVVAILVNFIENKDGTVLLNQNDSSITKKIQIRAQMLFNWFANRPKLCLILSAFFFGLACYVVYYTKVAYNISFSLLLAVSLYFFLNFSYRSRHKFSDRSKKIIKLFASYSFTLYILHYTLLWILSTFKSEISPYLLFVIGFSVSNLLSLVIAYFTEMRSKRVKDYFINKLITNKRTN